MENNNLVVVENLYKNYGGKNVLDNVSLNIERGKIVGILGANGSGKTTFIKILSGLIKENNGKILVNGNKIGIKTKSMISYLPDKVYFSNWMKVNDVVNLFDDFYSDFRKEKAIEMCTTLGIKDTDRIKCMSKGTKEKLQLILVMSRKADLYVLDEPIAGVDPAARDYIIKTIINNYEEDSSIIITSHLISEIESILDNVIFINEGKITRIESVDELKEKEGKSIEEIFRDDFRMETI